MKTQFNKYLILKMLHFIFERLTNYAEMNRCISRCLIFLFYPRILPNLYKIMYMGNEIVLFHRKFQICSCKINHITNKRKNICLIGRNIEISNQTNFKISCNEHFRMKQDLQYILFNLKDQYMLIQINKSYKNYSTQKILNVYTFKRKACILIQSIDFQS